MIKKIIDKRNYIIMFIIIFLLLFILFNSSDKKTSNIHSFNYFDEVITIEIYTEVSSTIFTEIGDILKKYDEFYQKPYNSLDLIDYGKMLYGVSDGVIDMTASELFKAVKNKEEYDFKTSIDNIDENTDLDVSLFIGYYAMNEVKQYLEDNNIYEYIINENGNIIAGEHYNNSKYKISIMDSSGDLIEIVELENQCLAIRGDTSDFKSYMVNAITFEKITDKLVVVIGNDINEVNMIASILYLISKEDGEKFIRNYDVAVLWDISGEVSTSNFNN